jgi:phosphoglycerol transferase
LVGLALAIDALRGWLLARRGGRLLAPALVAAVGVLGVLDVTSPTSEPLYAKTVVDWRTDARFVSGIEAAAPPGAMILQLPFHPFPEVAGTVAMADYDLFKGYVHSRNLRWSYGAMKGRPQEWTDEAAGQPLSWVLPASVAAGFAGVYVDRAAYDDHGAAIEAQVRRALGDRAPAVTSADGRLVYYDAGSLARRLSAQLSPAERQTLGDSLVHPVHVQFGAGVYGEEVGDGKLWRWVSRDAVIDLDNPAGSGRRIVFTARASAAPGTARFQLPGGGVETVRFAHGPRRLRMSFVAPPGRSAVRIHVDVPDQSGADPRDLRVQLFSPKFADATVRVPPRP